MDKKMERIIQNALVTSAEYWQERGDDNLPDRGETRDDCYTRSREYRQTWQARVDEYGDWAD